MAKHRLSFWWTTATSAVATLGLTALMLGFMALGRGQTAVPYWVTCFGLGLAALLILPLIVASALIAAGGIIALRRDALEAKGMPYASSTPREATPLPVTAAVRAVLFGLCAGDMVEIRSLEEILRTLDEKGTLGGLPFMPEMAAYCGTRARVLRRVDKLNDWINGTGLKRMHGLVLLAGLRCDGSAHGLCQSNCHLRWREEWLRPAGQSAAHGETSHRIAPEHGQLDKLAVFASRKTDDGTGLRFVCQATELTTGGTPLRMIDLRHYARDFLTGNVRSAPLCIGVALHFFNRVQRMQGGTAFPYYAGRTTTAPPNGALGLQPGDLVRVKSKDLIEPTLNSASRNRGLYFDRDMIRFCGGVYRVKARVERVIIEKTGQLRLLTIPCIILDGVVATGEYQGFNPEGEYIFWREAWLERVSPVSAASEAPIDDTAIS